MKAIIEFFDDNPFVALIVLALVCGTVIEVTSIIFLHKIVSLESISHSFF